MQGFGHGGGAGAHRAASAPLSATATKPLLPAQRPASGKQVLHLRLLTQGSWSRAGQPATYINASGWHYDALAPGCGMLSPQKCIEGHLHY